ncbi:EamA family transporter [Candidatus Acetothermia bacterium]|nr:EamA family transporter [Candidatus Acetothermia bacterium]
MIWGSTFLFIRIGNETVPALWAATLRLFLASMILGVLVFITRQKFPKGASLRAALVYGFFQFGMNFALLYWSERIIPSGVAAVLYATIPLSMALFARAFGLERLNPLKFISALLALVGVVVIFSGELNSNVPLLPLFMALMAATSASLATMFLKRVPPQPAIASNAVGSAIGAVVCFVGSFIMGESHEIPLAFEQWLPILYLTIMGSVVAFVSFAWLLNHWSATSVSFETVIVPVIAVILGAIVRSEQFAPTSFLGAALVLVAVVIALLSDRPKTTSFEKR